MSPTGRLSDMVAPTLVLTTDDTGVRTLPYTDTHELRHWYDALARYFEKRVRICPNAPTFAQAHTHVGRVPTAVQTLQPILAVDAAATACLLDGQAYVPVLTKAIPAVDASVWQITLAAAPVIVTVGNVTQAPLYADQRIIRLPTFDASQAANLQQALAQYGQPGSEPTLFNSVRQKLLELVYEADSVGVYEQKYHAGAAYHYMDRRLVALVRAAAERIGATAPRILDLGCGPGSLIPLLKTIPNVRLAGADLVPEMIDEAKRLYPDVEFVVGDAEALSFPDSTFDVVLCSGMLHHFPTLDGVLGEVRRVLRPGGAIVAREPNEDNFAARHPEFGYALLTLRYYLYHALGKRPVVEPEAHEYHRAFTGPTLVDALADAFRVDDFHTTLAAAYFLDETLTGAHWEERLAQLEEALSAEPGLNIIVTASHATPGVTNTVRGQLRHYEGTKPMRVRAYETLFALMNELVERYPVQDYFDAVRLGDTWNVDILKAVSAGRAVVTHGIDVTFASAVPLTADPAQHRAFDLGAFRWTQPVGAHDVRRALNTVQDCGIAYLECPAITGITNDDLGWLAPYMVLRDASTATTLRLVVTRALQSAVDCYKALDVALLREREQRPGLWRWEFKRLRSALAQRLQTFAPDTYSYGSLLNSCRTLAHRLAAPWTLTKAAG